MLVGYCKIHWEFPYPVIPPMKWNAPEQGNDLLCWAFVFMYPMSDMGMWGKGRATVCLILCIYCCLVHELSGSFVTDKVLTGPCACWSNLLLCVSHCVSCQTPFYWFLETPQDLCVFYLVVLWIINSAYVNLHECPPSCIFRPSEWSRTQNGVRAYLEVASLVYQEKCDWTVSRT